MKKDTQNYTKPNDAWILHREEIETIQDGSCNIYVLLDAYSSFVFGQEISVDLPSVLKITKLLKDAHAKSRSWPTQILTLKTDPFAETLQTICHGLKVPFEALPAKYLQPHLQHFKNSFKEFKHGSRSPDDLPIPENEKQNLEAFIPDSYGPCACASGKKFKFCCQKAFKDITFAMCDAQDGHLDKALRYMKQAEEKVGRTAEILCRYAICWSFFDMEKCKKYLDEALMLNPNHPRANYISGIEAVADEKYDKAIGFYQKAIESYPENDKFHLNETYNNLGTAYFSLKKYKEAKEVWKKAVVLLPSDEMAKRNLFEFIYENPSVPKGLREISPFIEKFLSL
ncbi:MAG: tetratricopeptide repeat protein [Bdellovibrio sp.]